jgi:hypothetical protein
VFGRIAPRRVQATLLLWCAPMKPWLPYPFATVPCIVVSLTLTLPGCSGAATPIAPSAVEQLPSDVSSISKPAALVETSRKDNTFPFPLVSGSFTLTLNAADGGVGTVKGTYGGEVVVSEHGSQTATLHLQITETSGIGSTISAIEAEGTRHFIDEGDFALSLLLTSSLTKSPLRVTIRGTSQLSCSASQLILVTLHGTDSTRGFLEITADLQHEVEIGAGC